MDLRQSQSKKKKKKGLKRKKPSKSVSVRTIQDTFEDSKLPSYDSNLPTQVGLEGNEDKNFNDDSQKQAVVNWMHHKFEDELHNYEKQSDFYDDYESRALESNAKQLLLNMSQAGENHPGSRTERDYFLDTRDVFEARRGKHNHEKCQKSPKRLRKASQGIVGYESPSKKSSATFTDSERKLKSDRRELKNIFSEATESANALLPKDSTNPSSLSVSERGSKQNLSPNHERSRQRLGLKKLKATKQTTGLQNLFPNQIQINSKLNRGNSYATQNQALKGDPVNKIQSSQNTTTNNVNGGMASLPLTYYLDIETEITKSHANGKKNAIALRKKTTSLPSSKKMTPKDTAIFVKNNTLDNKHKKLSPKENEQEIRIDTRADNPLKRTSEKSTDTSEKINNAQSLIASQRRRVSEIMKACLPRIVRSEFTMDDPLYLSQKMHALGAIMDHYKKWKDENAIAIQRVSAMRSKARADKQKDISIAQNAEFCEQTFNDQNLQEAINGRVNCIWKFKEEEDYSTIETEKSIYHSGLRRAVSLPRISDYRHSSNQDLKPGTLRSIFASNELRNSRHVIYS